MGAWRKNVTEECAVLKFLKFFIFFSFFFFFGFLGFFLARHMFYSAWNKKWGKSWGRRSSTLNILLRFWNFVFFFKVTFYCLDIGRNQENAVLTHIKYTNIIEFQQRNPFALLLVNTILFCKFVTGRGGKGRTNHNYFVWIVIALLKETKFKHVIQCL